MKRFSNVLHIFCLSKFSVDFQAPLPVALEAHFYDVKCALSFGNGNAFEPIEYGHDIAATIATIAIGSTAHGLAVRSLLA